MAIQVDYAQIPLDKARDALQRYCEKMGYVTEDGEIDIVALSKASVNLIIEVKGEEVAIFEEE